MNAPYMNLIFLQKSYNMYQLKGNHLGSQKSPVVLNSNRENIIKIVHLEWPYRMQILAIY